MIRKRVAEDDRRIEVTFELPASIWAERIAVVGDFNDWDPTLHLMKQTRDNENWHITLLLEPDRAYRFCYLIDDHTWVNEPQADDHIVLDNGIPCSVIVTGQVDPPSVAMPPRFVMTMRAMNVM